MSKYIDADKLREKIAEQMEALPREAGRGAGTITSKGYGMMQAFQIMRSIIDSLQQEQQDFPTTDEQVKEFLATHPKIKVPEKYKNPDWVFKKQEQLEEPDTSLEEAAEKRASEYAERETPKDADGEIWKVGDVMIENRMSFKDGFIAGAEWQKEQMLKDAVEGEAEKDLGWHSVDESLPPVDEEVIVLTDALNLHCFHKIGFAHIVNQEAAVDIDGKPYKPISHNGWNVPGVNYWMPMPMLPEEDEK